MDPQQIAGLSFVGIGAIGALLATLRYVKNSEDGTVDNLRREIRRLNDAVVAHQVESARRERQIDMLVKILRQNGIAIPDEFWAI